MKNHDFTFWILAACFIIGQITDWNPFVRTASIVISLIVLLQVAHRIWKFYHTRRKRPCLNFEKSANQRV